MCSFRNNIRIGFSHLYTTLTKTTATRFRIYSRIAIHLNSENKILSGQNLIAVLETKQKSGFKSAKFNFILRIQHVSISTDIYFTIQHPVRCDFYTQDK